MKTSTNGTTKAELVEDWIERFPVTGHQLIHREISKAIELEYGIKISRHTVSEVFRRHGYSRRRQVSRLIKGQQHWPLRSLSKRCGYSISRLRELIYEGKLCGVLVDGRWYLTEATIRQYIQEQNVETSR